MRTTWIDWVMKLTFGKHQRTNSNPSNVVNWLLDKRFLTSVVYGLFSLFQLLSLWRQGTDIDQIFLNGLFFGSAFYFYYQRRYRLKFPSQYVAQVLGVIIFTVILVKSVNLYAGEAGTFWTITMPIRLLGLALISAGFYGLKQYKRLLTGSILMVAIFLLGFVLQTQEMINTLSANATSLLLWYLGFNSSVNGSLVYVDGSVIDVHMPCTFLGMFLTCISFLVTFYLFFDNNPRRSKIFKSFLIAFLWTFLLSIIRLAIMALVVNNEPQFDFWHGKSGSNFFMSVGLIGCGWLTIGQLPLSSTVPSKPFHASLNTLPRPDWAVKSYLLIVSVFLVLLIVNPDGGARRVSDYKFPNSIPLTGWQVEQSSALPPESLGFFLVSKGEEDITPELIAGYQQQQKVINVLMAGHYYQLRSKEFSIDAVLSYVLRSDLKFPNYSNLDFSEDQYKNQVKKTRIKDQYVLVRGKENKHLISCLTTTGRGVINSATFGNIGFRLSSVGTLTGYFDHFLKWLTGRQLTTDRRCVWVHLAASSDIPDVDQKLVGLWTELKGYWSQSFPRL